MGIEAGSEDCCSPFLHLPLPQLGRRSRETVRYKQAYMSEEDALAEAGEVRGGYSVDASLDDDDVLQVPPVPQSGGYGTLN